MAVEGVAPEGLHAAPRGEGARGVEEGAREVHVALTAGLLLLRRGVPVAGRLPAPAPRREVVMDVASVLVAVPPRRCQTPLAHGGGGAHSPLHSDPRLVGDVPHDLAHATRLPRPPEVRRVPWDIPLAVGPRPTDGAAEADVRVVQRRPQGVPVEGEEEAHDSSRRFYGSVVPP